jgi:hypothetical protein
VTTEPVDAESVYESHSLSADLRDTIVKMIDVAQRIRKIEHF